MDKIAVLIPCYNEEQTIARVVEDFRRELPGAVIYVYDNNSTDGTAKAAEASGAVVRREYMQGKGNVIRRMFREIDAECYLMTDGDDTYPAQAAPAMVKGVLDRNADMVVGDRLSSTYYQENKRPFHNFGNWVVRRGINSLFHSDIRDVMTGYRAFSYDFVKTFPVLSRGFEIETEMTIFAINRNLRLENLIIDYRDRPTGSESKLNTYTDGVKVLTRVVKLFRDYRPLSFFSLISVGLLILAGGFFLPVFLDFLKTSQVAKFPTLIVCGFCVLAAILSFFAGLILDTMNQKGRQDYEFELKRAAERKGDLLRGGTGKQNELE